MSQTPLTDAYLLSRSKGENKQSWVEFAQSLELKLRAASEEWPKQDHPAYSWVRVNYWDVLK